MHRLVFPLRFAIPVAASSWTQAARVLARVLALSILAYMSAVGFSAPSWAQDGCSWFGTRPFCDGQCPSGFAYTGRRESCTTGSRRYCCPARFMTPGKNCQWVGNPGSILWVCDAPPPKPAPPPAPPGLLWPSAMPAAGVLRYSPRVRPSRFLTPCIVVAMAAASPRRGRAAASRLPRAKLAASCLVMPSAMISTRSKGSP